MIGGKNTQKITSVGEDVEKSEPLCIVLFFGVFLFVCLKPSCIADGNVNGASAGENNLAVTQHVKHRITI